MSVPARLAAFAVVLALVLGGAALAGSAVDPTDERGAPAAAGHGGEEHAAGGAHAGDEQAGGEHGGGGDADEHAVREAVAIAGYRVAEAA